MPMHFFPVLLKSSDLRWKDYLLETAFSAEYVSNGAFPNMANEFEVVCAKIEEEKEFLNTLSQEIWRNPELCFQEFHAHALLTDALEKFGFKVERRYRLETAFRAEYNSKASENNSGPTVAILLEYDALPEIGHACGHNLISEAGLAAAIAVKEIMDRDPALQGKLVVMGTPAEESGGGKIKLIEKEAFNDIDAAIMVHPSPFSYVMAPNYCNLKGSVEYIGRECHSEFASGEGVNALDAAVMCYNNISVLRQQIRPDNRIHVILKESGERTDMIPAKSRLDFSIRTMNSPQMLKLRTRIEMCMKGAAVATGCKVKYHFDDANFYQNVIFNKVLCNIYEKYFVKLGMGFDDYNGNTASSDIGNVSHVIPTCHPLFSIPTKGGNHTKKFTEAAGSATAQKPTLTAAKAMAMTVVSLFRNPDLLKEAKTQFEADILNELSEN